MRNSRTLKKKKPSISSFLLDLRTCMCGESNDRCSIYEAQLQNFAEAKMWQCALLAKSRWMGSLTFEEHA
jgi:hypothetical protein